MNQNLFTGDRFSAATILAVALLITVIFFALKARADTLLNGIFLLSSLLFGMVAGRYHGTSGAVADVWTKREGASSAPDYFMWLIYAFVGLYIVAYVQISALLEDITKQSPQGWELLPWAATAFAIFALAFVAAQYAAYLRITVVLAEMGSRLRDPKTTSQVDTKDFGAIWRCVFRLESLYEPPGNLFVTIGILGTFLGLAFGLTTLPLDKIVEKGHGLSESIKLALPFIRSMGLALGISTIGVASALAAHFWRSFAGPAARVETLLSDTKQYVE